jgi:hypothetical protein
VVNDHGRGAEDDHLQRDGQLVAAGEPQTEQERGAHKVPAGDEDASIFLLLVWKVLLAKHMAYLSGGRSSSYDAFLTIEPGSCGYNEIR